MIHNRVLKALRMNEGYTKESIGSALGVGTWAVSSWERGRSIPIKRLVLLAKLYGVTLDSLINWEKVPLVEISDQPEGDDEGPLDGVEFVERSAT